jgi:DnaK suppressor protein
MDPERARELLAHERDRIERALAGLRVSSSDDLASEGMADSASQLYEDEFDVGQVEDLLAELAAVKHAEERLAAGTYGLSVESGEPIPDERLEAVPTAERTVEEQERFAHQAG